jgi:hypothetical protein
MENRIKECQLDLYADRTSPAKICANHCGYGLLRWLTSCSAPCVGSLCTTIRLQR